MKVAIRIRTRFVATLSCLTAFAFAGESGPAAPESPESDPTIKAMKDEMARSLERLRLESSDPPFLVNYALTEQQSWFASATFGAITGASGRDARGIGIEVRVGDYTMDNTNFAGGFGFGGSESRIGVPKDDSYEVVRQRLWLATDQCYKGAVEQMAAKKAWLKSNTVTDHPGDLSKVEPLVRFEEKHTLQVDADLTSHGKEIAKKLSALFREAPAIQSSSATFVVVASNETRLSSEGSFTRKGESWARVTVTASTQATDGMPLGDLCAFYARGHRDLPSLDEMEAEVKRMISRLSAQVSAPRADEYIGPVLLEGEAAAFAMMELIVDRLASPHEPLGAKNAGSPFKNRLKKRVAPPFLSLIDDPTLEEFEGRPFLASFTVDDDGVLARPVELIEEGRLKNWYMSRIPTRAIRDTNGHSRGGVGAPGCVIVRSSNAMTREQLRAELLRIAKEQELPYAIRVETLARGDVSVSGRAAAGGFSSGTVRLSPPIAAYRVYPDGREEPIRGGEWQGVTLRTLRDIFVTGDRAHVVNALRGAGMTSIACPDLLIEEIEMKKPAEQEVKRPYLEHPFFAASR